MKSCRSIFALLFFACMLIPKSQAQNNEVKVNILAGAVTIFNPSFEIGFGQSSAITVDYVGAFTENNFMNSGHPLMLSMAVFGYRQYLSEGDGFFLGGDFGLDQFRTKKEIIPIIHGGGNYAYDVGYGYLFGITAGYKYNISRRFNIEASISGGWHHARHECYDKDGVRIIDFNSSGEWTPYKAGVYISYIFLK